MKASSDLLGRIGDIGADPSDDDTVRVQKRFLVTCAILIAPAAVVWGLLYLAFDEPLAAAIPLGYAVFSTTSIVVFMRVHGYALFRAGQLLLILLLPFLLQVALGGFVPSSAVVLWSMLCPFGALVFADVRKAVGWFVLFCSLVVLSPFLELRTINNLPETVITLFFVMNVVVVSTIVFVLLASFVRQLAAERARSESLLLNVLPKPIADRLKRGPGVIADSYDDATIIFADVVGSTILTRELTPREMVTLLDEYVARFDLIAERYGVEKIRTIGDNWMGVAGVPRPRRDHAECVARMALEMLEFVRERQRLGARCLDFRIGLNSGPVIGGVIGRSKFVFDIWGDAVNHASRMESTGVPGRIQIGARTRALLPDEFICEPRGTITIKGHGETETWFLAGLREAAGAAGAVHLTDRTI